MSSGWLAFVVFAAFIFCGIAVCLVVVGRETLGTWIVFVIWTALGGVHGQELLRRHRAGEL